MVVVVDVEMIVSEVVVSVKVTGSPLWTPLAKIPVLISEVMAVPEVAVWDLSGIVAEPLILTAEAVVASAAPSSSISADFLPPSLLSGPTSLPSFPSPAVAASVLLHHPLHPIP